MKLQIFILAMLCPLLSMCQPILIKGKVINERGEAIPAATIILKRTQQGTMADAYGEFSIKDALLTDTLLVSASGYETSTEPNNERGLLTVTLKRKIAELDEAVVIGYGSTTRRLNTGNVFKVSAAVLERQPVSNPLAALSGRVPGLVVTQTSGMPGAAVRLQIRGQSSFTQGSEPFYIIDGVPFAPGNADLNQFSSALASSSGQGLSPFNSLSPQDIESIEILKDADATAIYGSRGANGVILITTKKGKAGKVKLSASLLQGASYVTRPVAMLSTEQYRAMRKEAFANDGLLPTATIAPDLAIWDSSRYTNLPQLLLGGTAGSMQSHISASGGNNLIGFLLSGDYRKEKTVFPGSMNASRGSVHVNFYTNGQQGKYSLQLTANYSSAVSNLVTPDITNAYRLPPNLPNLYTVDGALNWQEGGVAFDNPMAFLQQPYTAVTNNLLSNLLASYQLLPGLFIKVSTGFNQLHTAETGLTPLASLNPVTSTNATGSSRFGDVFFKSWITEPQLNYSTLIKGYKLQLLVGGSWQETIGESKSISATGYSSDALLSSISGATALTAANSYNQYRYNAVFGRMQVNKGDRYLLTLSGRRDGSSRFGTGKQFSNFGAIGAGWLFSKEQFIAKHLSFISYGKLRASYGVTGNDQIGNYQYLDSWRSTSNPYQGVPGLTPSRLFNPDYAWEVNRKLEAAIETGFLKDRLLLSVSYFRNRSGNQLVRYTLPSQTGFASIIQNLEALVQNKGYELMLSGRIINKVKLQWTTQLTMTIHRNKLLAFPGLAQSVYSTTYVVGEPLSVINSYRYTGVNAATGVFQFEDVNGDNLINNADLQVRGNRDARWYGGMEQEFRYGGWQLNIFFEARQQQGRNYLAALLNNPPGRMVNQPVIVLNRWQKPGDVASLPAYTSSTSSAAYRAWNTLGISDGIYSDASFLRLKNVAASYDLPVSWLKKIKASTARLYVQAQNLFTITDYAAGDPETQNLLVVPPLRTISAGIQLTF